MRTDRGFTLVELIVVISIITILTTIATLSWNKMVIKGAVESQIKTVHADMMSVRLEALYSKRARSVVVSGTHFSIYSSNITTGTPVSTRTFKYNFINTLPSNTVTFDASGMVIDSQGVICVTTGATNDAFVDSIAALQAKINLGKHNGAFNVCTSVTQR